MDPVITNRKSLVPASLGHNERMELAKEWNSLDCSESEKIEAIKFVDDWSIQYAKHLEVEKKKYPKATDELTSERAHDLWCAVQTYGAAIWSNDEKPDGQAAWQPIKALLLESPGEGDWKLSFRTHIGRLGALGSARGLNLLAILESSELEGKGDIVPSDAHYYAQLLRIPSREKCSLRRLLQVAYNSGQLKGSGALERLTKIDAMWSEAYEQYKLGKLGTYCDYIDFRVPGDLLDTIQGMTAKLSEVDKKAG